MKRIAMPSAILGLVLLGSAAPAFASMTLTPPSPDVSAGEPSGDPSVPPADDPSQDPSGEPSQEPTKDPRFEFGFDKVKLSTNTVTPGGKIGITVICPTSVTATSNAFVSSPVFSKVDDDTFSGTGTFKKTLADVLTLKITCTDYGYVIYTTRRGDKTIRPGGTTGHIPSGAPDTGDGSLHREDGSPLIPLIAGGSAVVMAAIALGVPALRRRRPRQEQS